VCSYGGEDRMRIIVVAVTWLLLYRAAARLRCPPSVVT
jgi:hypothetical protein